MTHSKFTIVGGGILGLSVAEYFSRQNFQVCLFTDENPLSGSFAAAANLATKGQLFGRDAHFQMKLDAKKKYAQWLTGLITEISYPKKCDDIFKCGLGLDIFNSFEQREKHLKRVLQAPEELLNRKLPLDFILPSEENKIIYQNEAWVDAKELLFILKRVLKKRSVFILEKDFQKTDLDNLKETNLIFCTGAWTRTLLNKIEIPTPPGLFKQERLTVGSTFEHTSTIENANDFSLIEKVNSDSKQKATFSGEHLQYLSSTSLKIKENIKIDELKSHYQNKLTHEQNELQKFTGINSFSFVRTGVRVGYGHSEIVIENLESTDKNYHAFVCCGAHKSGFLFAPVIGEEVEKKIVIAKL